MDAFQQLKLLLTYLSDHINQLSKQQTNILAEFEDIVSQVVSSINDLELYHVLEINGWMNNHFELTIFNAQLFLNALSNYYFKKKSKIIKDNDKDDTNSYESKKEFDLDKSLSFIPECLVKHIYKESMFESIDGSKTLSFNGACMLVDISGFSKFSGAMCLKGVSGLDDLRHATNDFLGYYVKQVYDYEGDVIAFAGDALVTAFPTKTEHGDLGMAESCYRTLQCAHILRKHQTESLSTHIAVSCGEMKMALLGGDQDQWVYLFNGKCVSELSVCIEDAGPQQVAATKTCFNYAMVWDTKRMIGIPKEKRLRSKAAIDDQNNSVVLLESVGVRRTVEPPPPLSPNTDSTTTTHSSDLKQQTLMNKQNSISHAYNSIHISNINISMNHNNISLSNMSELNAMAAHSAILNILHRNIISKGSMRSSSTANELSLMETKSRLPSEKYEADTTLKEMRINNESLKYRNNFKNIDISDSSSDDDDITITNNHNNNNENENSQKCSFRDSQIMKVMSSKLTTSSNVHSNKSKINKRYSFKELLHQYSQEYPSLDCSHMDNNNNSDTYNNTNSSSNNNMDDSIKDIVYTEVDCRTKVVVVNNPNNNNNNNTEENQVDVVHCRNMSKTISKFISRSVDYAIKADALELMGELRLVTTVFISVDTYSPEINADPSSLQSFFLMAQIILHETGAFLRQFLVDDKGCVLIAMWGVPSYTYSNNCSRALYCAVKIREGALVFDCKLSIGIKTGTVFCGIIGCEERRDYAGIGTDVNMAARLMGKAKGRILVDADTYQHLDKNTKKLLVVAEEMQLKGIKGLVTPYKYASTELPVLADSDVHDHKNQAKKTLTQSVRNKLLEQFNKLHQSSHPYHVPPLQQQQQQLQLHISDSNDMDNQVMNNNNTNNSNNTHHLLPAHLDRSNSIDTQESSSTSYYTFVFVSDPSEKLPVIQSLSKLARQKGYRVVYVISNETCQYQPYGVIKELFIELLGKSMFTSLDREHQVLLIQELVELVVETNNNNNNNNNKSDKVEKPSHRNNNNMVNYLKKILGIFDASPSNITHSEEYSTNKDDIYLSEKVLDQSLKVPSNTFYMVLCTLLKYLPSIIVIENIHYCDELSWKELYHIQRGSLMNLCILFTMDTIYLSTNNNDTTNLTKQQQYIEEFDTEVPGCSIEEPEISINDKQKSLNVLVSDKDNKEDESKDIIKNFKSDICAELGIPEDYWIPIVEHKSTLFIELGNISKNEIKHELKHWLTIEIPTTFPTSPTISPSTTTTSSSSTILTEDVLAEMLWNLSGGNTYWCRTICEHINEHGFEDIVSLSPISNNDKQTMVNSSLRQMVLVHFEKLSHEVQVISKYASVIGNQLDETLLQAIIPQNYIASLAHSLEEMMHKGILYCKNEKQRVFVFPNKLLETTLYSLSPPSTSSQIHLSIARYLEQKHCDNLKPFLSILGYHYQKAPVEYQSHAFKYRLKSADQAISSGAYDTGLLYLYAAKKLLSSSILEYNLLLQVIDRALDDLDYLIYGNSKLHQLGNNIKLVLKMNRNCKKPKHNAILYPIRQFMYKYNNLKFQIIKINAEKQRHDVINIIPIDWQLSYSSEKELSFRHTKTSDTSELAINTISANHQCQCIIS